MRQLKAILILLLAAGGFGGCSLAYDFTECESDADCEALAGAGRTGRCIDNQCVMEALQDTTGGGDTTDGADTSADTEEVSIFSCTTNADCMENSEFGEGFVCANDNTCVSAPACAANTDCINRPALGVSYICAGDSTCVNVVTEDCRAPIYSDLGDQDNVVFLGTMFPLSAPYETLGQTFLNSVILAVDDFNKETTLPGFKRPALVVCDTRGSATVARRAATHLTDVVDVPAVIGPLFSQSFISATTSVTAPRGVFSIAIGGSSPAITTIQDNNLAWRVVASDVYQSHAFVDRIEMLGLTDLIILYKDDIYGDDLQGLITSLLQERGGVQFTSALYPDPVAYDPDAEGEPLADRYISIVTTAIAANPNADGVLVLGSSEANSIIQIHAGAMLQSGGPGAVPRYIVPHAAVPDLNKLFIQVYEANDRDPTISDLLLARVEGISPNIFDTENFPLYTQRYIQKFPGEAFTNASTLSYDAALVVLLAISALGDEAPTGAAIAEAMPRLQAPEGEPISFGDPNEFAVAVNALVSGGDVDLQGVSGNLTFDENGDVRSDYLGWNIVRSEPFNPDLPYLIPTAPQRLYILNAPPAFDGTWIEL